MHILGRTDSNGGHWDYSTGTYHYHNSGSSTTVHEIINNDTELLNELEKKYSALNDEKDALQNQVDEYKNNLKEYGYNSIKEMNSQIYALDTKISNMWVGFCFLAIVIFCAGWIIGEKIDKNKK